MNAVLQLCRGDPGGLQLLIVSFDVAFEQAKNLMHCGRVELWRTLVIE
jgi:hypothetical protein